MRDVLPIILAGTLGAGAMLVVHQPLPPACEPIELVRFVGSSPEIHIIESATFGRPADEWLTQFDDGVRPEQDEEPLPHRRRRHGH
jgi:hypothetical protein